MFTINQELKHKKLIILLVFIIVEGLHVSTIRKVFETNELWHIEHYYDR